jgi:hypothetical protein
MTHGSTESQRVSRSKAIQRLHQQQNNGFFRHRLRFCRQTKLLKTLCPSTLCLDDSSSDPCQFLDFTSLNHKRNEEKRPHFKVTLKHFPQNKITSTLRRLRALLTSSVVSIDLLECRMHFTASCNPINTKSATIPSRQSQKAPNKKPQISEQNPPAKMYIPAT